MSGFAHVAIDGPAGSGKTTVARALSRELGLLYLDTGAMYRAVALGVIRAAIEPTDERAVLELAHRYPVTIAPYVASNAGFRIFYGDREVGAEIYANDVSNLVSVIAAQPAIRELMVARQRAIAGDGPVVMAGRDIGTIVLPAAPFKIYLTASVDARVARRLRELAARGTPVDESSMREQIIERDRLDRERPVGPLRPAPGALLIDSSDLSVEDVVARVAALVRHGASA